MSLGAVLHLVLHALIPSLVAWLWFRRRFLWALGWLSAAWLIDIDHLLATPIYAPGRCSIGFHPLHTLPAVVFYVALLFVTPLRLLGLGLLIHIALDSIDCLRMSCTDKQQAPLTASSLSDLVGASSPWSRYST